MFVIGKSSENIDPNSYSKCEKFPYDSFKNVSDMSVYECSDVRTVIP